MTRTKQSQTTWHDGIVIVRIAFGAILMYHGWEMLTGRESMAWLTTVSNADLQEVLSIAFPAAEVLSGVLIVVGLLTRATTFLVCVAFLAFAFLRGDGGVLGIEKTALLMGLISLSFLFTGAGRLSIDYLLFLNRRASHERAEMNRFGRYVSR